MVNVSGEVLIKSFYMMIVIGLGTGSPLSNEQDRYKLTLSSSSPATASTKIRTLSSSLSNVKRDIKLPKIEVTDVNSIEMINVLCNDNNRNGSSLNAGTTTNDDDVITVTITFQKQFNGIIYSQGYFNDPGCRYVTGDGQHRSYKFYVSRKKCGSKPSCKLCSTIENVLIIQNSKHVQTANDLARRITCSNLLNNINEDQREHLIHDKSIMFKPFTVDGLDVLNVPSVSQGDDIECWMDINLGEYPNIQPLPKSIKIGETLSVIVYLKDPTQKYDLVVRDCWAYDGGDFDDVHEIGNENHVQLSDKQGCSSKSNLFGSWRKVGDTDKTTIFYNTLRAFKFPDKMQVFLKCDVEICYGDCEKPTCSVMDVTTTTDCYAGSDNPKCPKPESPTGRGSLLCDNDLCQGKIIGFPKLVVDQSTTKLEKSDTNSSSLQSSTSDNNSNLSEFNAIKQERPEIQITSERTASKQERPEIQITTERNTIKQERPETQITSERNVIKPERPETQITSEHTFSKQERPETQLTIITTTATTTTINQQLDDSVKCYPGSSDLRCPRQFQCSPLSATCKVTNIGSTRDESVTLNTYKKCPNGVPISDGSSDCHPSSVDIQLNGKPVTGITTIETSAFGSTNVTPRIQTTSNPPIQIVTCSPDSVDERCPRPFTTIHNNTVIHHLKCAPNSTDIQCTSQTYSAGTLSIENQFVSSTGSTQPLHDLTSTTTRPSGKNLQLKESTSSSASTTTLTSSPPCSPGSKHPNCIEKDIPTPSYCFPGSTNPKCPQPDRPLSTRAPATYLPPLPVSRNVRHNVASLLITKMTNSANETNG